MSETNMDNRLEKGQEKADVHEQLAAEVYGVGDVDKFSSLGLRLRALVRRFGAEENGIERIPPSARIDQIPIGIPFSIFPPKSSDLFYCFTSGNCCVTAFALGALGPSTFFLGLYYPSQNCPIDAVLRALQYADGARQASPINDIVVIREVNLFSCMV